MADLREAHSAELAFRDAEMDARSAELASSLSTLSRKCSKKLARQATVLLSKSLLRGFSLLASSLLSSLRLSFSLWLSRVASSLLLSHGFSLLSLAVDRRDRRLLRRLLKAAVGRWILSCARFHAKAAEAAAASRLAVRALLFQQKAAFRQWLSFSHRSLVSRLSLLPAQLEARASSLAESLAESSLSLRKSTALRRLSIVASSSSRSSSRSSALSSFRRWAHAARAAKAAGSTLRSTILLVARAVDGRSLSLSKRFQRWRSEAAALSRREERLRSLLSLLKSAAARFHQTLPLAFSRLASHSAAETRLLRARRSAAGRIFTRIYIHSSSKAATGRSFRTWLRFCGEAGRSEERRAGRRAAESAAAARVTRLLRRSLATALGTAWRSWTSFVLRSNARASARASSQLLGAGALARTVKAGSRNSLSRAFNTLVAAALTHRHERSRAANSLQAAMHALGKFLNKRLAAAFSAWRGYLLAAAHAADVAGREAARRDLERALERALSAGRSGAGLRILAALFRRAGDRSVRAAFERIATAGRASREERRAVRLVVSKMARGRTFAAFRFWSEGVLRAARARLGKKRQAKTVLVSLLKLRQSNLSVGFAKLRSHAAFCCELERRKVLAARLLRDCAFKGAARSLSFALSVWKAAARLMSAALLGRRRAAAFVLSLAAKSELSAARGAFNRWQSVKRHYDYVRMHANKQIVRMGGCFLKLLRAALLRSFLKWRQQLALRSARRAHDSLGREIDECGRKVAQLHKSQSKHAIMLVKRAMTQAVKRRVSAAFKRWHRHSDREGHRENLGTARELHGEALHRQVLRAGGGTIRLYFGRVVHSALAASISKWRSMVERKKKEARSLHSYFLRAINQQLAAGWEAWRAVLRCLGEAEQSKRLKQTTVLRAVSRLAKTLLSQGFLAWSRRAVAGRRRQELRRLAAQSVFLSIQRLCNAGKRSGFNAWKREVERQADAEALASGLSLSNGAKFSCGLKLLKRAGRRMGERQLLAAWVFWKTSSRAITRTGQAVATLARTVKARDTKQLLRAFFTWRQNGRLCSALLAAGDMKIRGKLAAANILAKMVHAKGTKGMTAAFTVWRLDYSASKKVSDVKTNAAGLVIKSVVRAVKMKRGRAFFTWSHEVKKVSAVRRVVKRCLLGRYCSLALRAWVEHTRAQKLVADKQERCCALVEKVLNRIMRNKVNGAMSKWKAVATKTEHLDRMEQLISHAELSSEAANGAVKANAARLCGAALRSVARGMVVQFWLRWKTQIWDLVALEGHEEALWLEKKRKVLTMLHIVKKLMAQKLSSHFHKWKFLANDHRHKAVERNEACKAIKRMLVSKGQRSLERLWRKWLRSHSERVLDRSRALAIGPAEELDRRMEETEKRLLSTRRREIAKKVLRGWITGKAASCFVTWKRWCERAAKFSAGGVGLVKVLDRVMLRQTSVKAWAAWRRWTRETDARKARLVARRLGGFVIAGKVAGFERRTVGGAFNQWMVASVIVRVEGERRGASLVHLCRATDRARRGFERRNVDRGFRGWKELVVEIASKEKEEGARSAKLRLLLLGRAKRALRGGFTSLRRAQKRDAALKRVVSKMLRSQLQKGWATWKQGAFLATVVRQAERSAAKVKTIRVTFLRLKQIKMCLGKGFGVWRVLVAGALLQERRQDQVALYRKLGLECMARAAKKMLAALLQMAWRKWNGRVGDALKVGVGLAKMKGAFARLQKNHVARAFGSWTKFCYFTGNIVRMHEEKEEKKRELLERMFRRMLKHKMWDSWKVWKANRRMLKAAEAMERVRGRLLLKSKASALGKWKWAVKEAKFSELQELLDGSSKGGASSRITALVWSGALKRLGKAYRQWRHAVHMMAERDVKRRGEMKFFLQKMAGGNLFIAWNKWKKSCFFDLNLVEAEQEKKNWKQRLACKHLQALAESRDFTSKVRGWRKWRNAVAEQGAQRRALSTLNRVIARALQAGVQKGWRSWRNAVAEQGAQRRALSTLNKVIARALHADVQKRWRSWRNAVAERAKRGLKGELKKLALKTVFSKQREMEMAWGWNKLRLACASMKERERDLEKQGAFMKKWTKSLNRREVKAALETWAAWGRREAATERSWAHIGTIVSRALARSCLPRTSVEESWRRWLEDVREGKEREKGWKVGGRMLARMLERGEKEGMRRGWKQWEGALREGRANMVARLADLERRLKKAESSLEKERAERSRLEEEEKGKKEKEEKGKEKEEKEREREREREEEEKAEVEEEEAEEEERKWGVVFDLLDKNGDGVLTPREVVLGLRKRKDIAQMLGLATAIQEASTRAELMDMFYEMDKDKDDLVTREEFIEFEMVAHDVYVKNGEPTIGRRREKEEEEEAKKKKMATMKKRTASPARFRTRSELEEREELTNTKHRMGCWALSVVASNWQHRVCGHFWKCWIDRVQEVAYERKVAREYSHISDIMGAFSRLQSHAD